MDNSFSPHQFRVPYLFGLLQFVIIPQWQERLVCELSHPLNQLILDSSYICCDTALALLVFGEWKRVVLINVVADLEGKRWVATLIDCLFRH